MSKLISVFDNHNEGYHKLMHFETWRIAVLNDCEDLYANRITHAQKHDLTDEAFILLEGQCCLFVFNDCNHALTDIEIHNLDKHKVYVVPKGIYHTHILSHDAKVLIVENEDTHDGNSPMILIPEAMRSIMIEAESDITRKEATLCEKK